MIQKGCIDIPNTSKKIMKKKDEPHRNNLRNYLENWRNTFFILVGIIFIGFFLRIFRLTFLPVFGDEAIYIRWAQVMRAEPTLRFLPLSDLFLCGW